MHFGHLEPIVEGCLQTYNLQSKILTKVTVLRKLHLKVPATLSVFRFNLMSHCHNINIKQSGLIAKFKKLLWITEPVQCFLVQPMKCVIYLPVHHGCLKARASAAFPVFAAFCLNKVISRRTWQSSSECGSDSYSAGALHTNTLK